MGTAVEKAVCVPHLAEDKAAGYNMKGYTLDGMDFFNCYAGFEHFFHEVLSTQRPVLVETITQRFKGHSISDPGLYRTKEALKQLMQKDPIILMQAVLIEAGIITEEEVKKLDKEARDQVIAALEFADKSPWPDLQTLEEDVLAP